MVCSEDFTQICGSRGDHKCGVHAGGIDGQFLHQCICETGLSTRDPERAADSLEEECDGGNVRDIRRVDESLVDDDGDLAAEAGTKAADDLVTNPFAVAGANVESVDKTCADGLDDHGENHEIAVLTEGGDQNSRHDGAQTARQNKGDVAHTGLGG